jgi:transposase, IS5 family
LILTPRKTTRKAAFVARMDKLMPWSALLALIEPYYPKAGNGRPPRPMSSMLPTYCVANWFNLADEACEGVPGATTLLHFRRLLEKHKLGEAIFAKVGELLLSNGLKLCGGTIIAAPSSTKNKDKERPTCTTASNCPTWCMGKRRAYMAIVPMWGKSRHSKKQPPKPKTCAFKRAYRNKPLSERDKQANTKKSQTRAKAEQAFLPPKRLWGFAKVRYRGLAKNANRVFAMLALINIDKWGKPLMA